MKKTISFKKNLEFPTMIGEVTAISLDHNLKFLDESNVTGELKITGRYKMTEASRLEEDFDYQLPVEIILTEKLDLETAKVDIEDFYYEIENDDTMVCYIDIKVEGVEVIEELDTQPEPDLVDVEKEKDTKEYSDEDHTNSKEERCLEETPKIVSDEAEAPNNIPIEIPETIPTTEISEKIPKPVEIPSEKINEVIESNRECDGEYNMEMESEKVPKIEKESQEIEKETKEIEINQEVGSLFSSFKDSDETFATYSIYILRQEETLQTIIEKYHTTKEELEKYNDLTNLTVGTKIIIPTSND